MKALVAGAMGLVGQHICKSLENKGHRVIRMKYNELLFPEDYGQYDLIVHAAGYGQPLMFAKDKIATIKINTDTTNELFKFLKPGGKFLFVSTSEVYSGSPAKAYCETDIGTTTPQHPRACYIESKRCGEAIVMAYRDQGVNAKIARLALAYGPGTKKHDTRVLNQFVEQALTAGEIRLMDKGEAIRTYCYVEDAAEMIVDILLEGKKPVYNVGGKSTCTIKELAEKIGKLTGAKVILGKKGLIGAPGNVKLSLSLVQREFPMTLVGLDEGLKKTIEYQRKLYA